MVDNVYYEVILQCKRAQPTVNNSMISANGNTKRGLAQRIIPYVFLLCRILVYSKVITGEIVDSCNSFTINFCATHSGRRMYTS